MIWRHPWAWLGAAAVALPILIHVLSRGHARVHRFPTLRFLAPSRMLPTRRTRLNDRSLLAVRVAVLVAATAALAAPLLLTAGRTRSARGALARVLIVDTSASMQRAPAGGGRAADSAFASARRLAAEATTSLVIPARDPARALRGAVAWLEQQRGRAEVVVFSDFQLGTLDSADLAAVPPRIGLRVVRVGAPDTAQAFERRASSGRGEIVLRASALADRTDAEWGAPAANAIAAEPLILSGSAERARAEAAARAAATVPAALPIDTGVATAIVEPGYARRAELLRAATAPRSPGAMALVVRVAADPTLSEAAGRATLAATIDTTALVVVARTETGAPVVAAGQGSVNGRDHLLLFSLADAGSLSSAALISAATRARSVATPAAELEPATMSNDQLARWQRAPADVAASDAATSDESDGRWLWVAVLALLALETWMRRERRPRAAAEVPRDRAA